MKTTLATRAAAPLAALLLSLTAAPGSATEVRLTDGRTLTGALRPLDHALAGCERFRTRGGGGPERDFHRRHRCRKWTAGRRAAASR